MTATDVCVVCRHVTLAMTMARLGFAHAAVRLAATAWMLSCHPYPPSIKQASSSKLTMSIPTEQDPSQLVAPDTSLNEPIQVALVVTGL
jgi:hypothetical protein